MSVEYLPVGISCNLSCEYCYQDPMRDTGNISVKRDWEAVKRQLDKEGTAFTVFGGEPLLAPISHLEEVWAYGLERYGYNGIQTNGALITTDHISLFKKYKVGVGLSIDGPGELNRARCNVATTNMIHRNIEELCREGIIPSLIVTLTKYNTGRMNDLINWFGYLEYLGIRYVNLHDLEIEAKNENQRYDPIPAFVELYQYSKGSGIKFNPFDDLKTLLTNNGNTNCIWNACDPLTTPAVRGVNPDGSSSNCGRTNKDGINWLKADSSGRERYIALYHTPQGCGGCKGCRFFLFCKGNCPGTAIDGDWRNRTSDCRLWFTLLSLIEKDVDNPLSLDPRLKEREMHFILGDDHGDAPHGDAPHGDSHGDVPHGDSHGDSGPISEVGVTCPSRESILSFLSSLEPSGEVKR